MRSPMSENEGGESMKRIRLIERVGLVALAAMGSLLIGVSVAHASHASLILDLLWWARLWD